MRLIFEQIEGTENSLNAPRSNVEILSFLGKWHAPIPSDLAEYLAAVDGGQLTFPLFGPFVKSDFIGSAGTGDLLSHAAIQQVISHKFGKKSIYTRISTMGSDHDLNKTIPILYLGDGATLDFKPFDGKAYLYDEVIAESLCDLLVKQCLMPGFFRDQEDRYLDGEYEFSWVSYKTPALEALDAFKQAISATKV